MGVDLPVGVQGGPLGGQQAVLHLDHLLPHDIVAVLGQQVVDLTDGAGGAVLDGHHAVVRPALPESQKDLLPGLRRLPGALLPEEEGGGLLGVGAGHPLIEHPGLCQGRPCPGQGGADAGVALVPCLGHQLTLLPPREAQDGLIQGGDVGLGRLSLGQLRLPGQYVLLPGGVQHREAVGLLIGPHPARHLHPAEKQAGQLSVDGVDLSAVRFQFRHTVTSQVQQCAARQGGGRLDDHHRPGHDAGVVPAVDRQPGVTAPL